jgi:putative tryptophan/tyrosine transport system substrate-binding protein
MNRRNTVLALLALAGAPTWSFAQQPQKVVRIGILGAETASGQASRLEALLAGLRDLGYVDGRNMVIEFRWAEGNYDRLPALAGELVRLKVDVLVALGTKAAFAAKAATTTIPIVVPAAADAVASGLVASLARHGENVTGSAFFGPELMAKRLELLSEAVPRLTQVGVLLDPSNRSVESVSRAMEVAAKSLKLGLQRFEVRVPNEFDSAFAAMAKGRVNAVVVQPDTMFTVNAKTIAALAATNRLPLAGDIELAEAGGLIAYGPNFRELFRRSAYFVDKILKGANPADMPIEQPTKYELAINLKTAKALGITIPQTVLLRTDRIID